MAGGIAQLVNLLSTFLPLRTVLVVVGVVIVLAAPFFLESIRERQIRGAARRMVRADGSERAELFDRVLTLAGNKPARLVVAVDAALKYDLRDLRDRALSELATRAPQDEARLRKRIVKPPEHLRDPLEAAIRIEQLLAEGLDVRAREVLDAALARFPDDPELAELAGRVRERAILSG